MNIFRNEFNIKSAKEFLKQSCYKTKSNEFQNLYYIKPSLNENSKDRTLSKTEKKSSYFNFNENSSLLKQSSTKEDSSSKYGKFSSFYTYRDLSQNKNLSPRNEDSIIFNPREIIIKDVHTLKKE